MARGYQEEKIKEKLVDVLSKEKTGLSGVEISKKLGLNCLYLEISKNNIAAQTLYEKLNFKFRDNYFLMKLDL